METIVVSAPGKVILHGEHAVVYGTRALATSLDMRTFLRLEVISNDQVSLELPDIGVNVMWTTHELQDSPVVKKSNPRNPQAATDKVLQDLRELAGLGEGDLETKQLAVIAFLHLFTSIAQKDGKLPSIRMTLSSSLPTGAGLGSSAAFSTCLSSSLLLLQKLVSTAEVENGQATSTWKNRKDIDLINAWAFQAEKIIHGNPSGIDNSVSTYGGALRFQRGKITPVEKVPTLRILLTNTQVPRSTKALVAGVKGRYGKYPLVLGPLFDSIEAISVQCENVFAQLCETTSDDLYRSLEELIDMNQHLLSALGVSHPSINQVCAVTTENNLHTKLTGAGGGGCTFTLIPPDVPPTTVSKVKAELENLGFNCWETSIGGHGVRQHVIAENGLDDLPAALR